MAQQSNSNNTAQNILFSRMRSSEFSQQMLPEGRVVESSKIHAKPASNPGSTDSIPVQSHSARKSLSQPSRGKAIASHSAVSLPPSSLDKPSEDGYAIDKETGIKYRVLPGASKEALKANKKAGNAGLTLDQMRKFTENVEDFDVDDLDSAAENFLGHLRIAPDKNEIERLKQERIARQKEQNKAYDELQENLNEKLGDLDDNSEAFVIE